MTTFNPGSHLRKQLTTNFIINSSDIYYNWLHSVQWRRICLSVTDPKIFTSLEIKTRKMRLWRSWLPKKRLFSVNWTCFSSWKRFALHSRELPSSDSTGFIKLLLQPGSQTGDVPLEWRWNVFMELKRVRFTPTNLFQSVLSTEHFSTC